MCAWKIVGSDYWDAGDLSEVKRILFDINSVKAPRMVLEAYFVTKTLTTLSRVD